MDNEFKKLFSGLLKDAGAKADEGKSLVKNAIDRITRTSPSAQTQKLTAFHLDKDASPSSRASENRSSEKKKKPKRTAATAKQPSAFQRNLLKLKHYEGDLDDDPESDRPFFDMPAPSMNPVPDFPKPPSTRSLLETTSTASDRVTLPSSEDQAIVASSHLPDGGSFSPTKASQDNSRTKDKTVTEPLSEHHAITPRRSVDAGLTTVGQTAALTDSIHQEKQALAESLSDWRNDLGGLPPGAYLDESAIVADETLVERLQTVLDLIAGQIAQVQVKKNELEAQKLLFDSTCSTMYQEREDYRQAIEAFAEQISNKHEDLAKYLIQWENDSKFWSTRKIEIDDLRNKTLLAERQYQESIADHVEQITARQAVLTDHQDKLIQQETQWRNLSDTIADLRADAEAQQEKYRQQIAAYVEQIRIKQNELDRFMEEWSSRLTDWTRRIDALEKQKDHWDGNLSAVQSLLSETGTAIENRLAQFRESLSAEKKDLSFWLDEQLARLAQKKTEMTIFAEDTIQAAESISSDLAAKQEAWGLAIQEKLAAQQKHFDEEQARLQAQATLQIERLTEKLAEANELYLTLYREHQRQMAETLAHQPDIVTESIWRNRLSYAMAFIPELPVHLSQDDLSVLFGGIEVRFKSPYVPPTEATIQIKWQLFERLPESERQTIIMLCRSLVTNHKIEAHPVAQL